MKDEQLYIQEQKKLHEKYMQAEEINEKQKIAEEMFLKYFNKEMEKQEIELNSSDLQDKPGFPVSGVAPFRVKSIAADKIVPGARGDVAYVSYTKITPDNMYQTLSVSNSNGKQIDAAHIFDLLGPKGRENICEAMNWLQKECIYVNAKKTGCEVKETGEKDGLVNFEVRDKNHSHTANLDAIDQKVKLVQDDVSSMIKNHVETPKNDTPTESDNQTFDDTTHSMR